MGSAPFGERVRRELSEYPHPQGSSRPPPPLRDCHGCQNFKSLSAMFLASRLESFSRAGFTKGPTQGLIGITTAKYSTILHMLSTIKQQVRVTTSTLSMRPRESIVSIATKAGDSTICTKMQTDNFSSIAHTLPFPTAPIWT